MKILSGKFLNLVLILSVFFNIQTKAQFRCGHDLQYMVDNDPAYKENYLATEARIKTMIQNSSQKRLISSVINIPIVVHVIHLGEAVGTGSNISNAQILGAIQGLNDKYRNLSGTGVDMQINFCLATRDPNGNAASGINRVDGSAVGNYSNQGMYATQGVSPGS